MTQDTILLCAGPPIFKGLGNSFAVSGSMLPVNGKPVIGRILDHLLSKNITSVTIVHQATDFQLSEFLLLAYSDRMHIKQIPVLSNGNIVDSLRRGLEYSKAKQIRVILGDTLITDPYPDDIPDYIFVRKVYNSLRWCIARYDDDGYISSFSDKKESSEDNLMAVCGYYHFSNLDLLKSAVAEVVNKKDAEISNVLEIYNKFCKIKAYPCESWYDFGNIDTFFISKANLISGRYFNQLKVDPVLNTIQKISSFNEKLENELNWYLNIPEELKVLTPRIIEHTREDNKVRIIQEYYGYPTLAEVFLYYNLHPAVWRFIIDNLLLIHERIKTYKGEISKDSIRSVYLDKTQSRLDDLLQDDYWKKIFSKEKILLNKAELNNYNSYTSAISEAIDPLVENAEVTILHGDFCFSNILYDINSQISRIIDPRGSFGIPGIYGDPRYDIAKLRHSVCGLYDFITADLFRLEENESGEFDLKIYVPEEIKKIGSDFDKLIQEKGYKLKEIKLIEALLFLSMLPLHQEKPQRQKAMFLRGISLLNEVFSQNTSNNENSYRFGWNHMSN